jgi:hypothetical protein
VGLENLTKRIHPNFECLILSNFRVPKNSEISVQFSTLYTLEEGCGIEFKILNGRAML